MHRIGIGLALVLLGASPGWAQSAADLAGSGDLTLTPTEAADGSPQLTVRIARGDGQEAISGPVTVSGFTGSGAMRLGTVSWRADGRTVSGTVVGRDGATVATFQGMRNGTAVSGTYNTPSGYAGTWAWGGKTAPQ